MPITTDALKVGLEVGAYKYNVKTLGWAPNLTNGMDAKYLAIAAFNNENFYTVLNRSTYHASAPLSPDAIQDIHFDDETVLSSTKVKRSLSEPVVLQITKTTTIKAIAFALCTHTDCSLQNFDPIKKTWRTNYSEEDSYNYSIDADIPPKYTDTTPPHVIDCFQDLFMVIPVNIPVTAGGYLTIKGGDANFTYITVESTT